MEPEYVGDGKSLDAADPIQYVSEWDLRAYPIVINVDGHLVEIPSPQPWVSLEECGAGETPRPLGGSRHMYRAARRRPRRAFRVTVKKTPCRKP
jgi:hypothetical protein